MFGGSRLQLSGSLGACGCQAFFGVTADGGKSAGGFCLGGCQFFGCFFTGQGAALNGFLTQQLDLGLELFDIGFELRHSFQRMTQSQGCLDGFVSIGGEKNADDEIADEQDNRRNRKHSAGDRIMDDIGHKDRQKSPCDRGTQADIAAQLERLAAVIPVADLE